MMSTHDIYAVALDAVGKKKVTELIRSLGYYEEPTPELLMDITDKEGPAFSKPFGKLLKDATKTTALRAKMTVAAKALSKAAGKAGDNAGTAVDAAATAGMTQEQKVNAGLSYINALGSVFGNLIGGSAQLTHEINNKTDYTKVEDNTAENKASENKTLYIVLGCVGAVLLIGVILIIALKK